MGGDGELGREARGAADRGQVGRLRQERKREHSICESWRSRLNFTNALEDGVQTEGWWADGTAKKGETI